MPSVNRGYNGAALNTFEKTLFWALALLASGIGCAKVSSSELDSAERDLAKQGVSLQLQPSTGVSWQVRLLFPSNWKEYRELDSHERRPLRESVNALQTYVQLSRNAVTSGAPQARGQLEAKIKAASELRDFAAARLQLETLLVLEFRLAEAQIRFGQQVVETSGQRKVRTTVLIPPSWQEASPLSDAEHAQLEDTAQLVHEYVATAERLEPQWRRPGSRIGAILRARLEAVRPVSRYLEARSGGDARRIFDLLETIRDRGVTLGAEHDESDASRLHRRPMIGFVEGSDRTGLSWASHFDEKQLSEQEAVKVSAREFVSLAAKKLEDWRGLEYVFTERLEAQRRAAEQLLRYIDIRRAECAVLDEKRRLAGLGVELIFHPVTETVSTRTSDDSLIRERKNAREASLKRLREKVRRLRELDIDIEGVFYAEYQVFYPSRRTWMDAEIQALGLLCS